MAPALQCYLQAGLATSTHQTYQAAMKHFTRFCTAYSVGDPFPVHELLLCYFASYLAHSGLPLQTIKSYLAGVRNAHISMGLPDPREQSSLPLLKRIQAGISRIRQQSGSQSSRVRLPITIQVLKRLQVAWQGSQRPTASCNGQWPQQRFFLGFSDLGNSSQNRRHRGKRQLT